MDEKVFLDAENCRPEAICESLRINLPDFAIDTNKKHYFLRKYLTSSRSYKDFISSLDIPVFREVVSFTAMPRFIWVCEYIAKSELTKTNHQLLVDSILILNATESGKSLNYLILSKNKNEIIVKISQDSNSEYKKYKIYFDENENLLSFDGNLKGDRTKWLS